MDFMPAKKLGFGLMRLPVIDTSKPGNIDVEHVKTMVDTFIEKGFTYFDTAWMYMAFNSEKATKKFLVERYPRESYTLTTKLHGGFFNSQEEMENIFRQQLENTGVEYFDYYLLHAIDKELFAKYEKYDAFNWVLKKKEEGLIKHVGFSFHDNAELLDEVLTKHPEMEFVQLQLNYLDWNSDWVQSGDCYNVAVKHGKPVIVMEPVKGGTLANVPAEAEALLKEKNPDLSIPSWAIRFAASLDNVMVVLSGMSNIDQMNDNVSYMDNFVPLTEEEQNLCYRVADIINNQVAIPCTSCHYCTEGCPMNIPIPEYFSLYNEDMREDWEKKSWTANFGTYNSMIKTSGKASDCIECGQCEGACPQHLTIIDYLKDVAKHYESE